MTTAGIDSIAFYTPNYCLELAALAEARGVDPNKFQVGLGQEKMSVVPPGEDIVTMGANAASAALEGIDKRDIHWVMLATESGIDQSKAAGIFIHRLLELPAECRVVELKQACYSATAGLQMALSLVHSRPQEKILLIASDIARYGLNSKGESSQGAGAIAMVISANPRILSIDPISAYYTEDVMDFFRPNYREEALVDGQYSCELYLKLLHRTWEKYSNLTRRTFSDHARICYHVPVPRLVEKAHMSLAKFSGFGKLSPEEVKEHLEPALLYNRTVGNCYTASLYLSLLSLLENAHGHFENQRIGFYSYGSGCVGEFFSGIVQPGYRAQLRSQRHQEMLSNRSVISPGHYEEFFGFAYPTSGEDFEVPVYPTGKYRLSQLINHERKYEVVCESN